MRRRTSWTSVLFLTLLLLRALRIPVVVQSLPLSLSGVRRIVDNMDWGSALNIVRFGHTRPDQLDVRVTCDIAVPASPKDSAVVQGLPLSLSGVRRIMDNMDWGDALDFVSFGHVNPDQLDDADFYILVAPQNVVASPIILNLIKMVGVSESCLIVCG